MLFTLNSYYRIVSVIHFGVCLRTFLHIALNVLLRCSYTHSISLAKANFIEFVEKKEREK